MNSVIGLSAVLSRSDVNDVRNGRPRVSFTSSVHTRTGWRTGARNVRIRPPTNVADGGGWR